MINISHLQDVPSHLPNAADDAKIGQCGEFVPKWMIPFELACAQELEIGCFLGGSSLVWRGGTWTRSAVYCSFAKTPLQV